MGESRQGLRGKSGLGTDSAVSGRPDKSCPCKMGVHRFDVKKVVAKFSIGGRSVPHQHRDQFIILRLQRRIAIDIHDIDHKTAAIVAAQNLERGEHVIAKVAIRPAV